MIVVAKLRDQVVRFGFGGDDVRAVHSVERQRQLAVLSQVPFARWTEPSRCTGWSVHDVVRHIIDMGEAMLAAVTAAATGERYDGFRGFDPKTTPGALLASTAAPSPEATLQRYTSVTAALVAAFDGLPDALLIATPTGRLPLPSAVLHGLFDAVVHERDITVPLGCTAAYDPGQLPVVGYTLLLAARVACLFDRPFDVRLTLGTDIVRVCVAGAQVTVAPSYGAAVDVDPLSLLDGLAGRASLPDRLPAALALFATTL